MAPLLKEVAAVRTDSCQQEETRPMASRRIALAAKCLARGKRSCHDNRMYPRCLLSSIALMIVVTAGALAETFVIQGGKAAGKILTPASPSPEIKFAADELVAHLQKMTGARLEVAADPGGAVPAGSIRLVVAPNASRITQRDGGEQSFVIDQKGTGVSIEGQSDLAVLYGAYEYLSDLGVRWFAPGDLGTHLPARASIALDGQHKEVHPGFRTRYLWISGNADWHHDARTPEALANGVRDSVVWRVRNRLQVSYRPHAKVKTPEFPLSLISMYDSFGHNVQIVLKSTKASIEKEPERYPLVTKADGTKQRSVKGQICFTNRKNIDAGVAWALDYFDKNPDMLTASFSLQDTGGVCECDECTKANGGVNPAEHCDRLVWGFMNEVSRRIAEKRPDRGIAFFSSYGATEGPPAGTKAEGHIVGVTCHVDHNNHDLDDASDPVIQLYLQEIAALKATGAEALAYDYMSYPASLQPLALMRNVQTYHRLGFAGYTCEVMACSPQHVMVNWVQAQLAWNPNRDPRQLLEEYCQTYFGAAGADVLAVVDAIEASARKIPKVTLSGYGGSQEMLTDEVIAVCRQRFEQAAGKVTGIHAERLTQFRETIELYSRLAQAYRALYVALDDRTETRQKEAVAAFDTAQAYWNEHDLARFISPQVVPGWIERVKKTAVAIPVINPAPQKALVDADDATLRRELFAMDKVPDKLDNLVFLPKEWKFRIDLHRQGEAEGWMQPGFDDARWTSLGYGFFDDQGFQRYEGTFWYRTAFDAPALPKAERVFMRIGALDDDGRIYVNGRLAHVRVHLHGSDWMRSFEFDVTDFIKPGERNVVAICGRNDYGKGGLWKPVAIYTR